MWGLGLSWSRVEGLQYRVALLGTLTKHVRRKQKGHGFE